MDVAKQIFLFRIYFPTRKVYYNKLDIFNFSFWNVIFLLQFTECDAYSQPIITQPHTQALTLGACEGKSLGTRLIITLFTQTWSDLSLSYFVQISKSD